jgi:hypothetical protein
MLLYQMPETLHKVLRGLYPHFMMSPTKDINQEHQWRRISSSRRVHTLNSRLILSARFPVANHLRNQKAKKVEKRTGGKLTSFLGSNPRALPHKMDD